jgi:hypothetical protein
VEAAANQWRFLAASGSARLLYQPNPLTIEQITQRSARRLMASGATPFIHARSQSPGRVIDFYSQHVLPELG